MKVNTLIIGAQKAGTTSLFHYLKQHPDIYFSEIKELKYFLEKKHYLMGEEKFHSYFYKHSNESVIASSHVHLLASEKSIRRVHKYNPDMRFIIILRNPVDRAFSSHSYAIQKGWESIKDFKTALNKEPTRLTNPNLKEGEKLNLAYKKGSMYFQNLQNWFSFFPADQFFITTSNKLKNHRDTVMEELFVFLGVDETYKLADTKLMNQTGKVKSRFFQSVIKTSGRLLKPLFSNKSKIFLKKNVLYRLDQINLKKGKHNQVRDPEVESYLRDYFKGDLYHLKKELNISFD